MALFVLSCIDRPGALELRLKTREDHLAYMRSYMEAHPGAVRLGGPFLDAGGDMAGSLIVLDVADLAAAEAFSAADPYVRAGLFERVEIRPWRATLGEFK